MMSALVVDDDHTTRVVLGRLLEIHGFESQTANNGKEAVDMFAEGNVYDLVLMDLAMPVMNGKQATRILRGMGVSCLIVGITACGIEAWKQEFFDSGLDLCFDKPLSFEDIAIILEELENRSSGSL